LDFSTISLYLLGLVIFTVMMVFPDKRDWIEIERKSKKEDPKVTKNNEKIPDSDKK
jgi:hypothetical protein